MSSHTANPLRNLPDALPHRAATLAAALFIMICTFIAFFPAIHNQFLLWDDHDAYLANPDFRGLGWSNLGWMFTTFHMGHYQPLTWLTLGADYLISGRLFGEHPVDGYGMDPRVYHFTNIFIHSINAGLVFGVGLRLIGAALYRDPRIRTWGTVIGSAIAALLFALHPLRVENVAWVTERRDLVNATFVLLTVLAYVRASIERDRRTRWLAVTIVLYALSLLAKVSSVPLPVVLLALDWYPLRRFGGQVVEPRKKPESGSSRAARTASIVVEKIPFLALALLFAIIATTGQSSHGWMFSLNVHPLDARIAQSFYGLMFYLWKTFVPLELLPLYELRLPLRPSEPRFVFSFMLVMGLALITLVFRKRWPALLVAGLAYAAFLGPVLGLFQNGPQIVADRYSYLPSIGLMIVVGGLMAMLWRHAATVAWVRGMVILAASIVCATLATLTWAQCQVWRSTESIWLFTLCHDDNSAIANNQIGIVHLNQRQDPAAAVEYFKRARDNDPLSKGIRMNLRNALRAAGRFDELVAAWVEEAPFGEFTAAFHSSAAARALAAQQNEVALEHLSVAAALEPRSAPIRNDLAIILTRLGRRDDAIAAYLRAIELDPALHQPRYGVAHLYAERGQKELAIEHLKVLLSLKPDHANGRQLFQQLGGTGP